MATPPYLLRNVLRTLTRKMTDERTLLGSGDRSIFLTNAGLALLVFTFAGFALKAGAHPERLARYTPLVIVHGILMIAWLGLFFLQARLVATSDIASHRSRGRLSWILVALMLGTSLPVTYSLMVEFRFTAVFISNLYMLADFALFFVLALMAAKRKDLEAHKRYMLFASFSILLPALGRYSEVIFERDEPSGIMFLLLVIALPLLYDRSVGSGIHRSTLWGIGISICWFVLMVITVASPAGDAILTFIG